ncbi:hypothetical protein IQ243_25355 [Nostocales cyanobacterium LEGE 11386]|nr:hypothetical protein [Nostocales cyanobacterium LEGE 11386]
MNSGLIKELFNLIHLKNPLIALESPLPERVRLLTSIATECNAQEMTCYLWTLEDDQLHQLQINEGELTLQP